MDMEEISIKMTETLAEKMPFAFHMTSMMSFQGIVEQGLVPGGKQRFRNCSFFSAFPPFGK